MPDHTLHTEDDVGCALMGTPEGGCPVLEMEQDHAVRPQWCPPTQEKRFCYVCLTAERFMTSYNKTYWKQVDEFANDGVVVGQMQSRGAPDCPASHKVCLDDGRNCGCLIEILADQQDGSMYDLCQACRTRALPIGIPVAQAVQGRAVFRGMTCSRPRKGYRFPCVSPPGLQDLEFVSPSGDVGVWIHQQRLYDVSWDLQYSRTPSVSFIGVHTWGPYSASAQQSWVDKVDKKHPDDLECMALCSNQTAFTFPYQTDSGQKVQVKRYRIKQTCPAKCWKYSYPVYLNPLFS